jgi:hypothetical protein
MSLDQSQALSDGITFQASLPVDWSKLSSLPADSIQSQTSSANLRLLNALNILEELPQDFEKPTSSLTQSPHLEAKLDLILGMLGELLRQQAIMPSPASMTISAHSLSILDVPATSLPSVDDLLQIRLFLDPRYPQVLVLSGMVSSVTVSSFTLEFHELNELLQEQLDKFVFRHYRRAIAFSRQSIDS